MESLTNEIMGTGWKFPVEFRKSAKTALMLTGEEDISNSLEVLFGTKVGERLMHSRYGSAITTFLFMPMNRSTLTYMQAVISKEILFNEARIVLNDVDIQPSVKEPGRLDVIIDYRVTATNNRYNYVFPFYMREATNLER